MPIPSRAGAAHVADRRAHERGAPILRGARAILAGLFVVIAAGGLAVPTAAAAQQGRVAGRVLDDARGTPVPYALVRVGGGTGGSWRADTADAQGRFSLPLPAGEGPFPLHAERVGYRPLTVMVAGGAAVWRDLRLTPAAVALAPVHARPPRPDRQSVPSPGPGTRAETTVSWSGGTVPVDPGDLAGRAALVPGVRGGDGGISFLGQPPAQTRVTLDGAPFGATSLPQEAIASVIVAGSPYDVAQGRFSGGTVAATTLSGTNRFGAAVRTRLAPPVLQWAPSPRAAGPAALLAEAQMGAGGALVWNRLFWYAALSASRRSAPLLSLQNASPAVLREAGVHPDSAQALLGTLRAIGAGPADGARSARTDAGSALLRLDYDLSPIHSLMARVDGRVLELSGLGVGPLATPSSGTSVHEGSRGALLQISSFTGHVSNELRVYRGMETSRAGGEGQGPAGVVRLGVASGDTAGTFPLLRFGSGAAASRGGQERTEVTEAARLRVGAGHEVAAGVAFAGDAAWAASGPGTGTFTFSTLEELRVGHPSAFTRALGGTEGRARARLVALHLGDTWTGRALSVTAGARVEGRWYPAGTGGPVPPPPYGPGSRRVPSEWGISPRLGWTYAGGDWYVYGGAGEFRGDLPLAALATALGDDGQARTDLLCFGERVPTPEWPLYRQSAGAIPTGCAGGSSPSGVALLSVFAPGLRAPLTRRVTLGGSTGVGGFLRVSLDGSLAWGLGQPVAWDGNLPRSPAFVLLAEDGRPVFAASGQIDTATGTAAAETSRADSRLGVVRTLGAGGRSRVTQGSVTLSFPYTPRRLASARLPRVEVSYTFTRARDDAGALAALDGAAPYAGPDPLALARAPADQDQAHAFQLRVSYQPARWARLGILGRLGSGVPFTPWVDGDVNGDGQANDPAFIFDPAAVRDTVVRAGMERVLATAPAPVRACLERQLARVAARNSCRAGWTSALDLRLDVEPLRPPGQRRVQLSLSTRNALGLADRLAHGADGLRGWGGTTAPDRTLLRVRGFDPAASAYRYDVNPRFGRPDAARARAPFELVLEGRVTLGRDPAYQPLERLVAGTAATGRSPAVLRDQLARTIPNLPAQVLSVDSGVALALTPAQRERLAGRALAAGAVLAPLSDSLAQVTGELETGRRAPSRASAREIEALTRRTRDALAAELAVLREILTPAQWSRLPEAIRFPRRSFIPPRCVGVGAPRDGNTPACPPTR
ncbi:MAG TPA: carboxypeptidase regulatory-like domain-containing protein [Longimicrobium sp.]|nr:carboxypeptidase regulatory-like domain-containing protein [Longimicrobium sp.]